MDKTIRPTSTGKEKSLEHRALASKLQSLAFQLKNLLQKKIRLDIEIQRTSRQLSKLKKSSSYRVKISTGLESAGLPGNLYKYLILGDSQEDKDLTYFLQASAEAEEALQTVEEMEEYLIPENWIT